MEEHQPGQGGSANTPPFPRRSTDPESAGARPASGSEDPGPAASGSAPKGPSPDTAEEAQTSWAPPSGDLQGDDTPPPTSELPPDDEYDDWLEEDDEPDLEDELAVDVDLESETIARETRAAASLAGRASARLLLRAETAVGRGTERIAERLEETAQRLERLADDRLHGDGPRARAGEAAQSAARWIDDLAIYLRERDADALRDDLEHQVRERPLQTLLLAVAAGWIVGRIMR